MKKVYLSLVIASLGFFSVAEAVLISHYHCRASCVGTSNSQKNAYRISSASDASLQDAFDGLFPQCSSWREVDVRAQWGWVSATPTNACWTTQEDPETTPHTSAGGRPIGG